MVAKTVSQEPVITKDIAIIDKITSQTMAKVFVEKGFSASDIQTAIANATCVVVDKPIP